MVRLNWTTSSMYLVWSVLLVIIVGASMIMEAEAQRSMAIGANYQGRSRPRSIRGFKQAALSTARGFGKRTPLTQIDINNSDPLQLANRDSLPLEWIVEGVQNNPILARLLVQRLLDLNREGEISSNGETLSPLYITDKTKEDPPQPEDSQSSPYM